MRAIFVGISQDSTVVCSESHYPLFKTPISPDMRKETSRIGFHLISKLRLMMSL